MAKSQAPSKSLTAPKVKTATARPATRGNVRAARSAGSGTGWAAGYAAAKAKAGK